ncbi:MAG: zinc-binding dehydrogenase [Acidimicrobiia bacterium]|nr:zinc-binding dehydrogenase [Acidimicrobiia bacterium]
MKAMLLTAPGELVPGDVAKPKADGGQVLVHVTHSGICGTDYKIFSGAIPVRYPRIMGHEMAGEVVEAPASTGLRTGDRVIVDPEGYDGVCFFCRAGHTGLCPNGYLVGRDVDGGFAEYLASPASHVFRLPEAVDTAHAPLIQVLTTCLHAQRQVDIFPGEYVVVLGLGVTGQLHVQLAKARGATVIGVTRSADKRALAEKLGADLTIPGGDDAIAKVREATEGRGPDVVIETTGVVQQLATAIHMARPGGRILMYGIITAKEAALPFYDLYFKELRLINARVAKSEDYPASIALVERGAVRLGPIVSEVMPLGELKSAIGMLGADGGGQRLKIILDHN